MNRVKKQIKLDTEMVRIDSLKEQIAACRHVMELSLLMISVYEPLMISSNTMCRSSGLSNEAATASLSSKLDELADQIREGFRILATHSQPPTERDMDSRILNLNECVRAAEKFVSSAVTTVESRSQLGSEFGEQLTELKMDSIKRWIPEPSTPEEPLQNESTK